jgi:hypothetical protein
LQWNLDCLTIYKGMTTSCVKRLGDYGTTACFKSILHRKMTNINSNARANENAFKLKLVIEFLPALPAMAGTLACYFMIPPKLTAKAFHGY